MEGALLAFAGKVGGDHRSRRVDSVPFDSRHRFMAVLTESVEGRVTHVKGAPERVLNMSAGVDHPHWHARSETLARRGMRVLAHARDNLVSVGADMITPQVAVGNAGTAFDDKGGLTDERTASLLQRFCETLIQRAKAYP